MSSLSLSALNASSRVITHPVTFGANGTSASKIYGERLRAASFSGENGFEHESKGISLLLPHVHKGVTAPYTHVGRRN